jgi:hypothetical protein
MHAGANIRGVLIYPPAEGRVSGEARD